MTTNDNIYKFVLFLIATLVATACSKDDASTSQPPSPDNNEIQLNADVWRVMEGTRATTIDNDAALQAESFMCYAYNGGTTTPYIDGSEVSYAAGEWTFDDGKHYWPMSGSLDFFAYMPATIPIYITDMSDVASQVTYAAGNPQFKCVLPTDQSSVQEFICAVATGQNKAAQGASGVDLTFQHPFARINLVVGSITSNVTITAIRLTGVQNTGSYTHSAGWSSQSGSVTYTPATSGETTFIVVPQDWPGNIEVDAEWDEWDQHISQTLTATKATTWVAGYSYTYTLSVSKYALTVDVNKFTEQW